MLYQMGMAGHVMFGVGLKVVQLLEPNSQNLDLELPPA